MLLSWDVYRNGHYVGHVVGFTYTNAWNNALKRWSGSLKVIPG